MSEALRLSELMGAAPKGPGFIEYSPVTIHQAASELRIMKWSELEKQAIREYGEACAIAAIQAQDNSNGVVVSQGVPDGWQIVPKEPTLEMIRELNASGFMLHRYKAMLASAPPAPQAEVVFATQPHPTNNYLFKLLCEKAGIVLGVDRVDAACEKIARMSEQASVVQQEAIYQLQLASGDWTDQSEESYRYNLKSFPDLVRVVYTHPAQQTKPQPLSDSQALEIFNDLEKFMDQVEDEAVTDEQLAGQSLRFILDRVAAMKGTP